MEQNYNVYGLQEARPSGSGNISNRGENNDQSATAAVNSRGRGGPSGLAASAGGYNLSAAHGPSGVAVAGVLSGVVAGAGGDPRGVVAGGGTSGFAAGDPSGVAAGASSDNARGNRRRNHRHRHSQQQINAMEAYFKDNQHPDELQRNELALSLCLDPAQVKCWFQNKRTLVKSQNLSDEHDALQTENDALQMRKQQLIEVLRKNTCPQCNVGNSRQALERNNLRLENSNLRKEVESLKSTIAGFMVGQNQQHVTFQNPGNFSTIFQNRQNLPKTLHDPQNLSGIYENPQNLVVPSQILPMISKNSQNLPIISEAGNANPYPVDIGLRYGSTSITSSGDGIQSINVPTSDEFRHSLKELVVLAAEELKVLSMSAEPVWISSSADGATSVLNEAEYLSTFPNNFGPARLGYTCEASRHIDRVLMSPTQLLNILMNVNEWEFTFSDIVSEAFTLDLPSEGMNQNAAVQVMAAEYHIPTPLVPNRGTCFARYCTQHCEGVWVVVDVSVDKLLHTPENMTFQKRPSGCLIQGMSDGTSKITWIEHVYVDYTGVSTICKRLLRSGLGFGAKRWVSILKRQCQRIMSANVPLSTHGINNPVMLSPEGRKGILMFSERMVNYFTFGISGPRSGRWTQVNGNFGDDIRLMSTRAMDDPGLPNGTLLSIATSFVLSLAPNIVFNFLRDYKYRKEWDICTDGNEYELVCRIPYGEEANNCISIYKVMRREGNMLELQESCSDPVASHVVFASTEIRTIDAILDGGDPNMQPLLPFGFTIFPDGPSTRRDGPRGTLLSVSLQVLISTSPTADIDSVATTKVTRFFRCHCEKIKHALGAVGPNT